MRHILDGWSRLFVLAATAATVAVFFSLLDNITRQHRILNQGFTFDDVAVLAFAPLTSGMAVFLLLQAVRGVVAWVVRGFAPAHRP